MTNGLGQGDEVDLNSHTFVLLLLDDEEGIKFRSTYKTREETIWGHFYPLDHLSRDNLCVSQHTESVPRRRFIIKLYRQSS